MSGNAINYGVTQSPRSVLSEISTEITRAITILDNHVDGDLADLVVDWLLHLRIAKGLSGRSLEAYCKGMSRFLAWLSENNADLQSSTVKTIGDWQKWLYVERRLANRTRRQQLVIVRQFYTWLEAYRGGHNPAAHVPSPKVSKLIPRKYTTDDLKKIFETCSGEDPVDVRDYALLLLAYATGARREEMNLLQLEQLTFSERVGRVRYFGKGAKEREISFERPVVDAVRRWLTLRDTMNVDDKTAVWCNVKGPYAGKLFKLRTVDAILYRRCKQAKIRHKSLHALRVTFATDLYDVGERIEVIQILMGHENIETTRGYIVVSEKHQRAKMPTARINKITGDNRNDLPLWIKQKQKATENTNDE